LPFGASFPHGINIAIRTSAISKLLIINIHFETAMKKNFLLMLFAVIATLTGFAQADTTLKTTDSVYVLAATPTPAPLNVTKVRKEKPGQVYRLNAAADITVTALTAGWSAFAFTKIYSKDDITAEELAGIKKENVPGFDRWAIKPFNEKIDKASYIPFYAAMPAPLLLLLDNKIRKDGFKVMFLYLETMAVTGLLYTGSMYLTNRYRPYVYDPASPMDKRVTGNSKNSFYAGHVHLVGSSVFFIAKVWSDYHPESKIKWLFYTGAAGVTAATALMRHQAGMHFPSDLLLGAGLGAVTGILVPALHKNKSADDRLTLLPNMGNGISRGGVSLVYTFK
jgi:membrane-associated phospholipid phosphatase